MVHITNCRYVLKNNKLQKLNSSWKQVKLGILAWAKYWKVSIRGGIIGAIVGALPWSSWSCSRLVSLCPKQDSHHDKKFGDGNIAGVVGLGC